MIKDTVPVLVVAGETSGEQHAACLVEQVNQHNDDLRLRWFGSGGQRMATAGVELLQDVSQLGAIGPWDALAHLSHYWEAVSANIGADPTAETSAGCTGRFPRVQLESSPPPQRLSVFPFVTS